MKWISVKNELPEESLKVMVFLNDNRRIGISIAYFLDDKWWGSISAYQSGPHIDAFYEDYEVNDMPSYFVTHWMPLPEPPKENE
jgi:hypothetical protein